MGLKVSLREGESVKIGEDIRITRWRSPKGRLELDIDAPALVRILREKMLDLGVPGLHTKRRAVAI